MIPRGGFCPRFKKGRILVFLLVCVVLGGCAARRDTLSALIKALHHDKPEVRTQAARKLGERGLSAAEAWVAKEPGNAMRWLIHQPLSAQSMFAAEIAVIRREQHDGASGQPSLPQRIHHAADA